jgi:hypothetical protein
MMKAGTTIKRFSVLGAAAIVGMLMAGVVGNAATTLSTPNCSTYTYSLAAGATSSSITPPTNAGVLVLGTNTLSTNFSVASVNLVHVSGVQIRWVGLESAPSAQVVHGGSATPGTHVVYLDYSHTVDLEILSADTMVIHNKGTSTQTGNVKLIW